MICISENKPSIVEDGGLALFEQSSKPAAMFSEKEMPYSKLKGRYPYIQFSKSNQNKRIFFQNQKMYQEIQKNIGKSDVEKEEYFDDKCVGLLLGYPPSSVDCFTDEYITGLSVLSFHGLKIETLPTMIPANVVWLKNRYKLDEQFQTGIYVLDRFGSDWVKIDDDDLSVLNEFWIS